MDDDDDEGALASRSGAYWVSRARGWMGGRDWRKKRFLLFPYSRVNWSGEVQTRRFIGSSGSSGNGPDDAIMLTRATRRRCCEMILTATFFFWLLMDPHREVMCQSFSYSFNLWTFLVQTMGTLGNFPKLLFFFFSKCSIQRASEHAI